MKEITRIVTLTLECTMPELDDGDVTPRAEVAKKLKEELEAAYDDVTVHIAKVQDFVKDGDGNAEGEQT